MKSAGNLKSSLLFTPAKSISAPKAEAQPTEPKKSSIVGSVIAQLTVS